jgi:putative ABC transport system substrate-binding protein
MRRREFITLLGGAAAGPAQVASGQQSRNLPRIGFLGAASASGYANQVEGLRAGLRDLGYVEGANIILEYRWADGRYELLPTLAAELVRSKVDVIVTHGTPTALAAKGATTTIPIVMAIIGDPVATGVVGSLAIPGGNITGQSFFAPELHAKRIELLKEAIPQLVRAGFLMNPDNPISRGPVLLEMQKVAHNLNVDISEFPVKTPEQFDNAFREMERRGIKAVLVDEEGMLIAHTEQVVALARWLRIPSVGSVIIAKAGGFIGYGVDNIAMFRHAATFVQKILRGANPGDLPIERASKFQFVINLRTAEALGMEISTATLLRADEVIE